MATVARPERELRFYVEGRLVTGEEFWQAVRDLGGTATVVAHPARPLRGDGAYRLTAKGQAALSAAQREEVGRDV
jgi:hypothetical protein